MKIYAYVYEGLVWEIIPPLIDDSGTEIPIGERYAPTFVDACIDITDVYPQPQQGWIYSEGGFTEPLGETSTL